MIKSENKTTSKNENKNSVVENQINQEINDSFALKEKILNLSPVIADAASAIVQSYKKGGKLIIFGNGGSAADAQHIAAEMINKFYFSRPPLPALALNTNSSAMTAIGNDVSFDQVFSQQVEAFAKPEDIIWGISTSGNSKNVIEALKKAKSIGLKTIVLTGKGGGQCKAYADIFLEAPSTVTPRIQETHILIAHIICGLVEKALFGDKR
jgi:D-sedoheptulose 7-phosphate isomerase